MFDGSSGRGQCPVDRPLCRGRLPAGRASAPGGTPGAGARAGAVGQDGDATAFEESSPSLRAPAVRLGVHLGRTSVVSLLTSVFAGADYLVFRWAVAHQRALRIAARMCRAAGVPGAAADTARLTRV